MKPKFTSEELAEFEKCRAEIAALHTHYQGKKARQNDKHIIAARQRATDPKWKENNQKANQNRKERLGEQYSKNVSNAQRIRYQNLTEEERNAISEASKKRWDDLEYRSKMEAYYSSPEYIEYITKRNKELSIRPEWREKVSKNNKNKRLDQQHVEKHQRAIKDRSENNQEWIEKNCRPVKTPQGVFLKASQARDAYIKIYGGNKTTIGMYMRQWLKDPNKPEFRYLTWDEYNSLK